MNNKRKRKKINKACILWSFFFGCGQVAKFLTQRYVTSKKLPHEKGKVILLVTSSFQLTRRQMGCDE
jgi:hypothetical protein